MNGKKVVLYIYLGVFSVVAAFGLIRLIAPDFLKDLNTIGIDQMQPIYFAILAYAFYKGKTDTICKIGIGLLFAYILFVLIFGTGIVNVYDIFSTANPLRIMKIVVQIVLSTSQLFACIALLNVFDTSSVKLDVIKAFAIIANALLILSALTEYSDDYKSYQTFYKINHGVAIIASFLIFAFIILYLIDNYNGGSKDDYYEYDFDSLANSPQLLQRNSLRPQATANTAGVAQAVSSPQIISETPAQNPVPQMVAPATQPTTQPAPVSQPAPVQSGPTSLVQAIQEQQNNSNNGN